MTRPLGPSRTSGLLLGGGTAVSGSLLARTTTPTGPRPVSTRRPYQSSSNRLSRASVAPVIWGRCWTPSRTVSLNRLSKSRVQSEQITYVSTPSVGSPHARHGKREAVIWDSLGSHAHPRLAFILGQRAELRRQRPSQPSPLPAYHTNVACALPTTSRIVLDIELDLLPLLERVELARTESGMVEENLAAVFGAYEAEAAVSNQANHWTCCHGNSLLCRALSRRASTRATGESIFWVVQG
jgi:hypothetical protein